MSQTPRTDAMAVYLDNQFPATVGNIEINRILNDFEKMERERDALLRDKERLDWLGSRSWMCKQNPQLHCGIDLRAAIDSLIKGKK